ncbi:cupin domain-containing protein [Novosphingobium sp. BL-8A]|uniref:cupin domain-containing protein n=1 Tax=Novosphingobium sp. BL-8A TaxID=3127639 RepID=UPI003756D462
MTKPKFEEAKARTGSSYPPPFDQHVAGRKTWPLTSELGLAQFGVNRVELPPGTWSTQRHWHSINDEVVVVVSGELVAVTDEGEEILRPGDIVGFPAGVANPHHLQNRGTEIAVYYDIGGRDAYDVSTFPDMELEARIKMQLDFRPIRGGK